MGEGDQPEEWMADREKDEKGLTYRDAGVDIDKAARALGAMKEKILSTFIPGVAHEQGSFGGIFDLEKAGLGKGVLVASTDGVGTKVRVAQRMGRYDTVGRDLANHCVNDILVQGARPLFFLDYIAMGNLEPPVLQGLLEGLVQGCRSNGMALLGGETAEMPGLYQRGDFDLVGTILGIVPAGKVVTGKEIRPGDRILGLPSSGLHTNGYSLAQKVLFGVGRLRPEDSARGLKGTVGDALLAVHRSYLAAVLPLLDKFHVHGMAHITGGGIPDNLPRILPGGCRARIEAGKMPRPPIFDLIVDLGGISREEAYRVFNMGFGFLLVVPPKEVDPLVKDLKERGEEVYLCGEIMEGEKGVDLSF